MSDRKQIVDNLEPVGTGREIDSGDVHHGLVLALRVVAEKGQDGHDALRGDVEGQFVLVDRELLNKFGQACGEVLTILVHGRRNVARVLGGIDADGLMEWPCRGLLGNVLHCADQ